MKKLSLFTLFLIANLFCQTSYDFVGNQIISSYGIINKAAEGKDEITSVKNWKPKEVKLSEQARREILFSLLHEQLSPSQPELNEGLQQLAKDLELFIGNDEPSDSIFQILDRTLTTFGQAGLAKMLVSPSADIKTLQNRQELIKLLVEDEQLFSDLEQLLYELREKESAIFSYWQEKDQVATKVFDGMYWPKWFPGFVNKNAYTLEAKTRLANIGTTLQITGPLIFIVGAQVVAQKTQGQPINLKEAFVVGSKDMWNFINPKLYITGFKEIGSADFEQKIREGYQRNNQQISSSELNMARKGAYIGIGLSAALASFCVGIHTYNCKSALEHANQLRNAANHLQERLIGVGALIRTTNALQALAQHVPQMEASLSALSDPTLFESEDGNFAKLVSMLQSSTFDTNASFFSLTGRVLAAHTLMEEQKGNFARMMEGVGEVDACLAIARLYKEYEHSSVRFCFADFVQSEKPILQLRNFWNPFVDMEEVVVNDIEIGRENRNVVLTGSNTGGKSTTLKGMMISAWLAQTLGIAPATHLVMTPFTYLGTSLNVSDQTAKGNSLFKAEVLRAKSILNAADALALHKFGFVIIDELFVGTAPEKGAEESYRVSQRLAEKENVLFVLATHFPKLTNLENDTDGICRNFKMDISKDEAGNLVRTFKLEPGISMVNVADDIFDKEMNSQA